MPQTLFSTQLRVLLCDQCNAPLQTDAAGGQVKCQYCGFDNRITTRDDRSRLAPASRGAVSEEERLNRLRAQDGRPLLPPASLQSLFAGGQLPPWKVEEALAVWRSSRDEVRATGNFEAAERLLFLTMALANIHAAKNDVLSQRGMFETALEVVTLPRHRQILRGYLSRAAAHEGDLQAAEVWLGPCDAAADDLESDSAYRFSRAYLDAARGDHGAVLRILGQRRDEIPIMDAVDPVCTLLRANAHERSGALDVATALLVEEMGKGPAARETLKAARAYHGQLRLCEQSFPVAESKYTTVAGQAAAASAGGGVGTLLYYLGLAFLVGAGLSLAASLIGRFGVLGFGSGFGFSAAPGLLITGLILFLVGRGLKNSAARAERLRLHGIKGSGTVVSFAPTGTRINNVPQIVVQLKVQLEGQPPYEAQTRLLAPPQVQLQLQPGTVLAVRADPENLMDLIIETD